VAERLTLTVAADPFEIIRELEERHIEPEGLSLDFQPEMTNPVRHTAMVRDLAFDVCELNVCTYLIARDQGAPITALPIFLFRKFRHGNIFVHADGGIQAPADLVGKKIAVPNMQPASNVWLNGILQDSYGVKLRDIVWVTERDEDVGFTLPADLRIERAPAGKTAIALLLAGDVAAVMMPQTPPAMIKGDRRIRRLFPNYVALEQAYYRETGLFPIMHVTAVKTELLGAHPWIAASLMQAFEAAKQAAYKRYSNVRIVPLAWFGAHWEEERDIFGDNDPWAYGLGEANTRNLETVIRYSHEQGLIRSRPAVKDLFFQG
jgi:4,5-dihydroxyphthalate decarboxylase